VDARSRRGIRFPSYGCINHAPTFHSGKLQRGQSVFRPVGADGLSILTGMMPGDGYEYSKGNSGGTGFVDYAFINIGYSELGSNRLFVEIFGADGGVGFDQYVVTDIPSAPDKTFKADLRITQNSYSVAVDGVVINTVSLVTPLPQIDLFAVGVQRNLVGLEGAIDASYIYKTCR
jgi:hypothetical protein